MKKIFLLTSIFVINIFSYNVDREEILKILNGGSSKFLLARVQKLDLSNNNFEELPKYVVDNLENMTSLHSIDISKNRLTSLEGLKGLKGNTFLVEVNADNNQLNTLINMPEITNLQRLSVKNNNLASLTIPELPNLEALDASSNEISSFKSVPYLKNLKKLFLASNKIENFKHFPYNLSRSMTKLGVLDLSNNELSSFEDLHLNDKTFQGKPYFYVGENRLSETAIADQRAKLRDIVIIINKK